MVHGSSPCGPTIQIKELGQSSDWPFSFLRYKSFFGHRIGHHLVSPAIRPLDQRDRPYRQSPCLAMKHLQLCFAFLGVHLNRPWFCCRLPVPAGAAETRGRRSLCGDVFQLRPIGPQMGTLRLSLSIRRRRGGRSCGLCCGRGDPLPCRELHSMPTDGMAVVPGK